MRGNPYDDVPRNGNYRITAKGENMDRDFRDFIDALKATEWKAAQIERCYGEGYVDFKYFGLLLYEELRVCALQKECIDALNRLNRLR